MTRRSRLLLNVTLLALAWIVASGLRNSTAAFTPSANQYYFFGLQIHETIGDTLALISGFLIFLTTLYFLLELLHTLLLWLHGLIHPRRPFGSCAHCGYDLRATPHRCPECGHTP